MSARLPFSGLPWSGLEQKLSGEQSLQLRRNGLPCFCDVGWSGSVHRGSRVGGVMSEMPQGNAPTPPLELGDAPLGHWNKQCCVATYFH